MTHVEGWTLSQEKVNTKSRVCVIVCLTQLISLPCISTWCLSCFFSQSLDSHRHSHRHTHTLHTPLHLAAGCQLSLSWAWFIGKGGKMFLFWLHLLRSSRTYTPSSSHHPPIVCVYIDTHIHVGQVHKHTFTLHPADFLLFYSFRSLPHLFVDSLTCSISQFE